MLPPAQAPVFGRDGGRDKRESVCVRMWSTEGFVKGCAGIQDAHPKETGVFEFCFFRTRFLLYPACSYQFPEKCSAGCCRPPATSKETKSPEIVGNTLFSDS